MRISIILALFTIFGCGKNVENPGNLQKTSFITDGNVEKTYSSGSIVKNTSTNVSTLTYNSRNYAISPNSSYQALSFIRSINTSQKVDIKFKGTFKSTEIIFEEINLAQ